MSELIPQIILSEIFAHKSKEVIDNVIRIVEENEEVSLSRQEQLEAMINLLSEPGTIGGVNILTDELYDEAVGFQDDPVQSATSEMLRRLTDMFPGADPEYLEKSARELAFDEIKLEEFINKHLEDKSYPKLDDYLRRKKEQLEMDKYLSQFKLFYFCLEFPDPIAHFNNSSRKHAFSNFNEDEHDIQQDFALKCLYNQFRLIRESNIRKIFKNSKSDIIKSYNKLKKMPKEFRVPRSPVVLPNISIKNATLLHEIAFIQHEKEIRDMMKEKELNVVRAGKLGVLTTCSCCYTEDLIPEDCFPCKNGCKFCRTCIRKFAEVAYSEGKTEFLCLSDCGADYNLSILQMVLNPKTFTNLCHRIQMKEINDAAIDGAEHCPLCFDFVMIPDPEDLIFHCDTCNKDSCRKCKHEAHVPLRCNEIEYDEDVKRRTYIEDKMTEALVRKCYKCGNTFVKNSGCNKMTCSCGAKMCYVCRAPVTTNDYAHFNVGGCPLHTNDAELHLENVMRGANTAKADLGVDKNPELLKNDPTKDFNNL